MMNDSIARLGQAALAGRPLGRDEARFLAGLAGDELYDLFYWANKVRVRYVGRTVTFCSIAAAKVGGCSEDCKFCAQSARYPTHVEGVTKLTGEQIVRAAGEAAERGADSFGIVNSGRGPTERELDWLAEPMARVAAAGQLRCCASLGDLTPEKAQRLREIGVTRYNHNLETSRRHFPNVVTTHRFDDRVRTLRTAKAVGMSLCSGGIFNMGEDWDDRVDLALELRDIGPDVVPLNFLNPIPGTPLGDRPTMPPMEILKTIALYRLLLPSAQIKLAGGREVNLRDLQSWIFYCGASSCLIGNYLTTTGRSADLDRQMVRDLGLTWAEYETPADTAATPTTGAGPLPPPCDANSGIPLNVTR